MAARWRLMTSGTPGASAALAMYQFDGDVPHALAVMNMRPVELGEVRVRSFSDIDHGVVARVAPDVMLLMPHAGPAVRRRLEAWFASLGIVRHDETDVRREYPESKSLLEARMLRAVAHAASPLAVDLLLDQPRSWEGASDDLANDPALLARSRLLNRLIDPPLVVALGRPNIGKSTLLNALAGRSVSIVADEPGTTRDHVGVRLDLAGLVVNYVDTPGISGTLPTDFIQRESQEIALAAAARADLVLLCADAGADFIAATAPAIRVGLRADRGPANGADVSVSARTGAGIEILVSMVQEKLVPREVRSGPWKFWAD